MFLQLSSKSLRRAILQRFLSTSYWECPKCRYSNRQEIEVPELDFSAEKMADMGNSDQIEIHCDGCNAGFGGYVYVNADSTSFNIEEPISFEFSDDVPMYEAFDDEGFDYEPPENPTSIAFEALNQLLVMVGSPSPPNDPQFTNRLIFAGAISSFEAYLGDTLINAVLEHTSVRNALLRKNRKMGELKVSAREIADDPEVLPKKIVRELRGVLYHNLKVVTALFRDAFDIDLIFDGAQKQVLFPAMLKRHDCVHRNGQSGDGVKLDDFTDAYVRKVIDTIIQVVQRIDMEINDPLPF